MAMAKCKGQKDTQMFENTKRVIRRRKYTLAKRKKK
jgi:hypothetical protein